MNTLHGSTWRRTRVTLRTRGRRPTTRGTGATWCDVIVVLVTYGGSNGTSGWAAGAHVGSGNTWVCEPRAAGGVVITGIGSGWTSSSCSSGVSTIGMPNGSLIAASSNTTVSAVGEGRSAGAAGRAIGAGGSSTLVDVSSATPASAGSAGGASKTEGAAAGGDFGAAAVRRRRSGDGGGCGRGAGCGTGGGCGGAMTPSSRPGSSGSAGDLRVTELDEVPRCEAEPRSGFGTPVAVVERRFLVGASPLPFDAFPFDPWPLDAEPLPFVDASTSRSGSTVAPARFSGIHARRV